MTKAVFLFVFSALVWFIWQQPSPAPAPASVRNSIPATPVHPIRSPNESTTRPAQQQAEELWRVVTRRLITPVAAEELSRRLKQSGLEPMMLESRESIEMHAFDDKVLFSTPKEAAKAKNDWLMKNIIASVIKVENGVYLVGLGRYFQAEYAKDMQQKLEKLGKPYRYQRRNIPVPTWRFTFAAGSKQQAEKTWKQLQASGISMPVLMPEKRFQETYGNMRNKTETGQD